MKPSKKKIRLEINKKELNENLSPSRIENYFKSAAKQFHAQSHDDSNEAENAKAVYIEDLKKKLQEFADEDDEGPSEGRKETEQEVEQVGTSVSVTEKQLGESVIVSQNVSECTGCKDWESKYKKMKKLYMKLGVHSAELNLKYHDLLKIKTHNFLSDVNDADSPSDDVFTSKEIKFLQCMSLEKKADSSFIHQCMQYAYKSDLSVLRKKTLKGKSEVTNISDDGEVEYIPRKDPLSPKKVERIRSLFIERISKCELNPAEYGERLRDSNINRLIASSIINIGKKG